MKHILFLFCFFLFAMSLSAQDISLPKPQQSGGMPVFDAVKNRQSNRDITEAPIDLQSLSDILWAAWGFNRGGMRTIPTALNKQELDVYAVLKDGVYRYDAKENKLILVNKGDYRKQAGKQDYVYVAPVNLIFVADRSKETGTGAYLSTGCAVQNVYLVCASKGLACRIRTGIDPAALHKVLKLSKEQEVLAGQTIAQPKKQ